MGKAPTWTFGLTNAFRLDPDDILLEEKKRKFEETTVRCGNRIDAGYISIAHSLHAAVRSEEYARFGEILDKMMLPGKARLKVKGCKKIGLGDRSRLFLSGHRVTEDIFDDGNIVFPYGVMIIIIGYI